MISNHITLRLTLRHMSFIHSIFLPTGVFYLSKFLFLGPERRSVEIDNNNKTITAYHESGHAIIAYYTQDAMPINKATIMPRGPTLGHVSIFSFSFLSDNAS